MGFRVPPGFRRTARRQTVPSSETGGLTTDFKQSTAPEQPPNHTDRSRFCCLSWCSLSRRLGWRGVHLAFSYPVRSCRIALLLRGTTLKRNNSTANTKTNIFHLLFLRKIYLVLFTMVLSNSTNFSAVLLGIEAFLSPKTSCNSIFRVKSCQRTIYRVFLLRFIFFFTR